VAFIPNIVWSGPHDIGTTIKIIAGIMAIADVTESETAGATAATEGTGVDSIGATASEPETSEAASSGMGTGTKVALGLGAAAAVGGGVAAAVISNAESDSEDNVSFTGTFMMENGTFGSANYMYGVYTLIQNESSVTGTFELINDFFGDCMVSYTVPLAGTVDEQGNFLFSWPLTQECCSCRGRTCCARIVGGNYSAVLSNEGNILNISGPACTLQSLVCWGLGFFYRQ
jgi:hypothetical protein